MARGENQKLKLLYILDYLNKNTDEQHTKGVSDIIGMLAENGISAERKSIYSDIAALIDFGVDIISIKSKATGYYIGCRDFELPELKLLTDAVVSSKFITVKKTESLVKKLETLCSRYQATELNRQIYVYDRVKTMNESIYRNVDRIHTAIMENCRISFKYYQYDRDKQQQLMHNGATYDVSPYALLWDNENYYLLAYDAAAEIIKHYRVDRMLELQMTSKPRLGQQQADKIRISSYADKNFAMFGGEREQVRMRFENRLASVVIDRFGKDIIMMKTDDNHFDISIEVAVSTQFFAWIWGFSGAAQIISPEPVIARMRDELEHLIKTL